MEKVIIIGGGIGGLCVAVRLLNEGYDVTILEKEDTVGGKVNIKTKDGARFDLTASVLMTPESYTSIFSEVGKNYKDYFEIIRIDPIYKVNYYDGNSYKYYSDLGKMIDTLENIEEGLSVQYLEFLSKSFEKYLNSKNYFLDKSMISKKEMFNIKSIKKFLESKPFATTDSYLKDIVKNEYLLDYLIFKSMYIGVDPYKNSSLYTLVPAISHIYGLWYIKGGLYSYIEALKQLILELGGKIYVNTEVEKIVTDKNKVIGVRTNRENYKSDIIVCNADYPYAVKNLIKNKDSKQIEKQDYSCSVFMMYLGLSKKYKELEVHNIYIGRDFKNSIQDAFKGQLPKHPTLYLYYPSKIDKTISGQFDSILNITVRVPNLKDGDIKWNKETIQNFRNIIIKELKNIDGLENIENEILYESYLTPLQLKYKFYSHNGTAFGLSHKLNQTAYFRPHIKDESIKGLYYIGSSTHPGNGVSLIIDGSKTVVDEICKE
ncbi:MAG: phytoene desaturase [Romboutsia sp.]|nr:phytoene desaturase [Romboutsia sp.]